MAVGVILPSPIHFLTLTSRTHILSNHWYETIYTITFFLSKSVLLIIISLRTWYNGFFEAFPKTTNVNAGVMAYAQHSFSCTLPCAQELVCAGQQQVDMVIFSGNCMEVVQTSLYLHALLVRLWGKLCNMLPWDTFCLIKSIAVASVSKRMRWGHVVLSQQQAEPADLGGLLQATLPTKMTLFSFPCPLPLC